MGTRRKKSSCFLSSSVGEAPELLRDAFRAAGFAVVSPAESLRSEPLPATILREITRCDVFCAYVSDPSNPVAPAIWYELGVAKGLGKRTLVVLDDLPSSLPFVLQGEPVLALKGSTIAALAVQIGRATERKSRPAATVKPRRAKAQSLEWARAVVRRAEGGEDVAESEVAKVVAKILRSSGASLVEEAARGNDRRFDVAAWIDELQEPIGNPLVVEVKRLPSPRDLFIAQQETMKLLSEQVVGAGVLVVYPSTSVQSPEAFSHLPLFLTLGLGDFVKLVEAGSFVETLVRLRNMVVHQGR